MSIYKDQFKPEYQHIVGMNASKRFHQNSQELVSILKKRDLIQDGYKYFEIGSGGCRNLHYIYLENPKINFYANDLNEKASRDNMSEEMKKVITFYELDTLTLFNTKKMTNLDVLISSDHLMHIDEESTKKIIYQIQYKWKPRYILMREANKSWHAPNRLYPRIYHESYEDLTENYIKIHGQDTKNNPDDFFILLWKRKGKH